MFFKKYISYKIKSLKVKKYPLEEKVVRCKEQLWKNVQSDEFKESIDVDVPVSCENQIKSLRLLLN